MSDWQIKDQTEDRWIDVDTRQEGEDKLEDFEGELQLELIAPDGRVVAANFDNGGLSSEPPNETQEVDAEIVDHSPGQEDTDIPDNPDVTQDPVDWMPSHFIDSIQGVPTVNRKGYAVIAAQYNVSVVAEPVVRASETDFEHAEFKAIATTEDGQEYSGFGSAHIERGDGDDEYLLNELAETRAMKRAVAWATGVGMTAMSEMQNSL